MADKATSKPVELLELTLSPQTRRILQQITEERGIAISDVVEITICAGLPSVVMAATRKPVK